MSAGVRVLILTLSTLHGPAAVSGALSGPTNVRWTSYNMNLVLRWDPPAGAASGLVYTPQYKSRFPSDFRAGCTNTSQLQCDFSSQPNLSMSVYGKFRGRVRALLGAESSDWVQSEEIFLERDTIIGPPNVSLTSTEDSIDVIITDPKFALSTLKDVYGSATVNYNLSYWKEGHEKEARSLSDIQQSRYVLDKLELWTSYCVQVQINAKMNPNPSEPSRPVCERTTSTKQVPWVAAVVTFLAIAVVTAAVVVAVVYRQRISNLLCPKDTLPQRFKEAPKSSMYMAMQDSHPPEEHYDPVSIIADVSAVEERRPLQETGTSCSLIVGES
ncbi:interleukin-10 receptor subunit beta-like [Pagrus major]|uniref:interleukin-10 receptor subunit beta-like n=1 Tax=Pagrus major TaxID=143350 RepID=UPI003CC8D4BB